MTDEQTILTADQLIAPKPNVVARIPLDLEKIKHWPLRVVEAIGWLHRHMLENKLTFGDLNAKVGYSESTLSRLFSGKYPGKVEQIADEIEGYRKLLEAREKVEEFTLVETDQAVKIQTALQFCVANGAIVEIIGGSGVGKTWVTKQFIRANKYDSRVIYIHVTPKPVSRTVPELLAKAMGLSPSKYNTDDLVDHICDYLSPERALFIDEAIRLLPSRKGSVPYGLEYLRDIHDRTGCGIALIATHRLPDLMNGHETGYMYEQWIGRSDMRAILPPKFKRDHVRQLLAQFWHKPPASMVDEACRLVSTSRHMRELKRVVSLAQRDARKNKKELEDHHFFHAITMLAKMASGEIGEEKA